MSSESEPAVTSPPPLPYESFGPPAGVVFYELDSRRATLREYLFESKNPLVLLIAIVIKVLRVKLPGGSTDDPSVSRLGPYEVPVDEALSSFPENTRDALRERVDALLALGYVDPVGHLVETPLQKTQHAMVTLRAPDGRGVARAHVRVWHFKVPPKVKPFVELLAQLADGRFVWTANGVPDTIEPASCLWRRERKLDAAQTAALHDERVAALGAPVVRVRDADATRALVEQHHERVVDFHLGRKIFRPATPEAVRAAASAAASGASASDGAVLVEIDRQLNTAGSWVTALVVFFATLVAFVGLGAQNWGGRFVALLLPILLLHELGHYVAMRGFGYRNVRMFFLPLMGAAVSGRSFNVPAWKQAVVALAGPLPGILLAIPLGIAGAVLHRDWMSEAALLALIINGFNLLPILPLDGGRVAQLLLFRRWPLLDVAFRVVAVFAVIALAVALGDRALSGFAIALGISVPLAARVARATRTLRRARAGAPIAVPDGARSLPPDVAGEIVAELRRGTKRPIATKILATQTLEVFDALNAPAPRWPAAMSLGLIHAAFVALVLVSATGFAIIRNPSLMRAMAALATPRPALDPRDVESRRGDRYAAADRHDVVVATFKTPAAAKQAFAALPASDAGAACRLGPAIVAEVASGDRAARDAAFDALESAGGEPRAEDGGWANLTIVARTRSPEAARAIVDAIGPSREINALVPPWIEPDPRDAATRERNDRARRTDAALGAVQADRMRAMVEKLTSGEQPAADPEDKAIAAAMRRGDRDEATRLSRQRAERQRKESLAAVDAALAALPLADREYAALWKAGQFAADVDDADIVSTTRPTKAQQAALTAKYEARIAEQRARDARRRELLGGLPLDADGRPTPEAIVWWAQCFASREERVAEVTVSQRSPAVTLPIAARWLGDRSIDLRFDLAPGGDWPERRAAATTRVGADAADEEDEP